MERNSKNSRFQRRIESFCSRYIKERNGLKVKASIYRFRKSRWVLIESRVTDSFFNSGSRSCYTNTSPQRLNRPVCRVSYMERQALLERSPSSLPPPLPSPRRKDKERCVLIPIEPQVIVKAFHWPFLEKSVADQQLAGQLESWTWSLWETRRESRLLRITRESCSANSTLRDAKLFDSVPSTYGATVCNWLVSRVT